MESRRRLPHIYPEGQWLFVTWHLLGSLPHALYPPPHKLLSGEAFVWMDRHLDSARTGPKYLLQKPIAQIVVDSLYRGVRLGHYDLGAYVIMANHVHVLMLPRLPASRVLKALKGVTAREANKYLGRTGGSFWEKESYDHWVRDDREWQRIASYIVNNPVKAGIVRRAEEYAWSSERVETSLDAARTSACATKPSGDRESNQ